MWNDAKRISSMLSEPFLTSVRSINVSSGVVSHGAWQETKSGSSNTQRLYRLDLAFKLPVMSVATISIIITPDVYGQVRHKLLSLRLTSPHLFISDLP